MKEDTEPKKIKFPCLLEDRTTGNVHLFRDQHFSIILSLGENNVDLTIGEISKHEGLHFFDKFEGEITLSND
jgi:hypothetical protein